MIINKLKVLEERWELVTNNTRPGERRDGWPDGGEEWGGWEIIMLMSLALITPCP